MATMTEQAAQILQERIDSIDTEIRSNEKSIEGKAENRSNSVEWYQERNKTLIEKRAELVARLASGEAPDPVVSELSKQNADRIAKLETRFSELSKQNADKIAKLETRFSELETVEQAIKPAL